MSDIVAVGLSDNTSVLRYQNEVIIIFSVIINRSNILSNAEKKHVVSVTLSKILLSDNEI